MLSVVAAAVAAVVRRPLLLLTAYVATVVVAAPVAAILSRAVEPAMPGFAAPLDNLSAVFDLSRRPAHALAGAAAYGLVWVLLWGGVLDAFAHGAGGRGLIGGATAHLFPMLKLSLVALCAYVLVFLVLHPILFRWIFGVVTADLASERVAFAIRVAFYALLVLPLAAISLTIDYARVQTVLFERRRTFDALAASAQFIRRRAASVVVLLAASGLCFAGLLSGYWAFDRLTRGAPSLRSVVVVGQAYILGRLALRLCYAAAQVRLAQRSS
jgi:hypothetical protein